MAKLQLAISEEEANLVGFIAIDRLLPHRSCCEFAGPISENLSVSLLAEFLHSGFATERKRYDHSTSEECLAAQPQH
jgi:hypothetical protein